MHLKFFLIVPFAITLSFHGVLAGDSDNEVFSFSPPLKKEGFLKTNSREHQSSDSHHDSQGILGNSFGTSTAIPISRENTTVSTQSFSKTCHDHEVTLLSQSPNGPYTSSFTFSPNKLREKKKTPLALSLESGKTPVFNHMQILTKEEYANLLAQENSKKSITDIISSSPVASSPSTLSIIEPGKEEKILETERETIQKQQEMNPDNEKMELLDNDKEKDNSSDEEIFLMD